MTEEEAAAARERNRRQVCNYCFKEATTKNAQGQDVCFRHRTDEATLSPDDARAVLAARTRRNRGGQEP